MTPLPVDKADDRIRRMFGQIAPWYDFLNHLLSLNIDKRWRRTLARLAPPTPRKPILDLCTGTGDLAFALDRAAKGSCAITASDFCPEMLALARKKGERAGTTARIEFIEADAQTLPFPSEKFDLVTVSFGLRNIADPRRGLREMARVAAPGGRLAILEFSRPRNRILGGLYTRYFRKVLPRIGQMLSRSPESAYRYLPESVLQFPDGKALTAMMEECGWAETSFRPLTYGIATLYLGRKA